MGGKLKSWQLKSKLFLNILNIVSSIYLFFNLIVHNAQYKK